jgi:putative tryptophan/tyrosine transport system substrate-binding protein
MRHSTLGRSGQIRSQRSCSCYASRFGQSPFRSDSGGLIAYGINRYDLFHRAAGYVDRILKGASPSSLPVQMPTKFEMVINLKTAKVLGLAVPPTLLARADEVIG